MEEGEGICEKGASLADGRFGPYNVLEQRGIGDG